MWASKWLLSSIARRRERAQRRARIVQEMGGMPPRHLMRVGAAPASDSPNQTKDFRESQSWDAGILARRHFSR